MKDSEHAGPSERALIAEKLRTQARLSQGSKLTIEGRGLLDRYAALTNADLQDIQTQKGNGLDK